VPGKIRSFVVKTAESVVGDIEELLKRVLISDADVSSIVNTKVYPSVIPQDIAVPALTYQKISGQWQIQISGPHNMSQERFQINCWAATYAEVMELADKVRSVLNGYDGMVGDIDVHEITLDNETDLIVVAADTRVNERYGYAMDFIIWYKVAA
jgi:hypothetical protein